MALTMNKLTIHLKNKNKSVILQERMNLANSRMKIENE
jgi:hypothetical protein